MQKGYGIGSGISLFIATNICESDLDELLLDGFHLGPWVFWRLMGDKKHSTIFGIVFLAARMELESSLWWWSTSSLVGSIWSGNMLLPKTSSKWWNYYRILRLATVSTIVVFGQSCVHDDQMWCCEWRIQLSLGICQAVGFLVSWGIIWKAVGLEFGWSLSCL